MTTLSRDVEPHDGLTAERAPLDALTGIRFLAATYVIVFHTQFALVARARNAGAFDRFIDNGYLAVTLFFMLSGFILAYTYRGRVETACERRRFWEARFARLWPMYAVSLGFASVAHRSVPTAGTAVGTLLMVQAWNPLRLGMAAAWNPVCWTLSVEALFYVVFPWAQAWLDRRSLHVLRAVLAVTLVVCVVGNVSWRTLDYAPVEGAWRFVPYAAVHVPEFVTGVVVGNLLVRGGERRRWGMWTWVGAVTSVGMLCLRVPWMTSLVVPAFGALLFGLAAERTLLQKVLSTRALVVGGQISYSMYLLHLPLKELCSGVFDRAHVHSSGVRFGVEFAGILVVSVGAFYGVEDPARRWLRGVFLRLERRRTA